MSDTGRRVSIPACVNRGGADSIIRLAAFPELETEAVFASGAFKALSCWQARPGEILTAVDPGGVCHRVRLTHTSSEPARGVPFFTFPRSPESPLSVDVYQALPAKERFELILQKLTELGVARIVPFTSQRSSTLAERDSVQKKSHRWPDIVLRAARQCRRAMIPEFYPPLDWTQTVSLAAPAELKLMLFEGQTPCTLKESLGKAKVSRIALLVGPEGGFEPSEMEEARTAGFTPVSLGPRILRTETAAIVGTAMTQFALGDLG